MGFIQGVQNSTDQTASLAVKSDESKRGDREKVQQFFAKGGEKLENFKGFLTLGGKEKPKWIKSSVKQLRFSKKSPALGYFPSVNKKAHLSRKFVERFEREKKILTLLKNDKKTPDIVNRMIPSSSVIQNWSSLKASQTITSIFSYLRERVTTEQFKEIQKSFGTNTTCFDKVFIQRLGETVRGNQNQALIALWEFIVRDLDSTIDNVFSLKDEVEPLVLAAEHERNKMIFKQILEGQNENTKAQLIRAWMSDPLNAKALSGIEEVVLVNKNLKVFPEEIPRFFKNLRYLFLVDNKIESLPKEIGSLKNLKVLCISKNFCSELPEGFSKLENLTYLDFDNNCLRELPEEISTLKNLEVISVQNNRLKDLPSLEGLEELQDLWISGNRLVGQEVNIETLGKWKVKVHC